MSQRLPTPGWKPLVRLNGPGTNYGLRVGQAYANTNVRYEVVNVSGMQKIAVRFKGTAAGTLDIFFIGPDVDAEAALRLDTVYPPAGTIYTTGNATQAVVAANTEQIASASTNGEDYAVVKFTGTASGAVTYCDVARLSVGLG